MARGASADASGVRVVHHVPGRMRVRIDSTRHPAEMLQKLEAILGGLPAATSMRVNTNSGSVVIHYATPAKLSRRRSGVAVSPARYVTRGTLAPKSLVPLAVSLATRLVLPRHRGTPLWLELTLLAFDGLMALKRLRRRDGLAARALPMRAARGRPS